jgi:lipopolysaccharide heptosyltransferase I
VKLLIVRLSAMGDVVHTLPALELLRSAAPTAELTWVVEALAAPLLEGHPALDRVVVLDRRAATRSLRGVSTVLSGVRELRRIGFDAAIDFQGLARSALVAKASGARRIMGPAWAREGAPLIYSEKLDVPRPPDAHAVARYEAVARAALGRLGLPADEALPAPRLPLDVETPGARLVLLPGAGKPANQPPPELLASVADRCVEATPELEVVLVGGPGDQEAADEIARRCEHARPRSLCGSDLRASALALSGASVVVGGDTGPLHLARALGRPVVGLFHAAEPFRTGPAGLPVEAPVRVLQGEAECAPCRARHCLRADGERICLEPLTAERIAELVAQVQAPSGN